jgi:uncharacterized repeat protein (TIGR03803 family)
MTKKMLSLDYRIATLAVLIFLAIGIAAGQETVLYSFYDAGGAVLPVGGVISDSSGNLYGTTFYGGANGAGTVFELTPSGSGWSETVLHSFNFDGIDGFFATGGLVFDAAGNLYGTTQFGGTGTCTNGLGCGTVFELTPATGGGWTESVIHDFTGADGWEIHAGLAIDGAGNLYGTGANGGNYGQGTVFEISPGTGGHWTTRVLHHFTGATDGGVPYGNVILDASGNLYGMTSSGGGSSADCLYGCGTVFELGPLENGRWAGKTLHSFSQVPGDGRYPSSALTFDAAGNLYGATGSGGGPFYQGVVFELTPAANGPWQEKMLHSFSNSSGDGINPSSNLIFDAAGNLYSSTLSGGANGEGTVFELTPTASGNWTETLLYNFSSQNGDGANPIGNLVFDASGNIYGTTDGGGSSGEGSVFEITR